MNRLAIALAASTALAASAASAQTYPPPPPPPYQPPPPAAYGPPAFRHLGLALRFDLGIGYLGTSASPGDLKISGGGGSFGFMVGGAISENLILGGELWDVVTFSPTFTQGGVTVTGVSASMALVGVGVNLTYYFMPANVYLSLSPSITNVNLTTGGMTGSTESGFGMKIALGKEWWVADHWGIGLAGQFYFSSNVDKGPNPPTWSSLAGGIAFSATYN